MNYDKFVTLTIAIVASLFIATVGSCSYNSAKNYNECVISANSVEIAELCKRAK